ncbi:hypothetical protein [Kocuria sp. CNJ-770]|uniref:hypothetical protein n=1 Tax=Kocuria sp. CNJ-770 TaxID=1904964 RepID=UPI0035130B6F
MVTEQVTGQPVGEVFEEQILDPLGLDETTGPGNPPRCRSPTPRASPRRATPSHPTQNADRHIPGPHRSRIPRRRRNPARAAILAPGATAVRAVTTCLHAPAPLRTRLHRPSCRLRAPDDLAIPWVRASSGSGRAAAVAGARPRGRHELGHACAGTGGGSAG